MVGEKSIVEGIGVGYREDPWWAKKNNPIGSGRILKKTLAILYMPCSRVIVISHVIVMAHFPGNMT